jgi:diguanylate cyclase (GGDEF)-like protein
MSLRQKLMAVLAIPGIVLIVATGLAYQTNERRTEATHLLRRSYEVRNTVDLIVADLSSAESGVRGYLITGDRGMLYPYEAASERLGRHLRELRRLVVDNEAARLVRMLDDHANQRLRKLGRLLAYAPVREDERDEMVALAKGGDVTMHHVLGITERLRTRETALLSERSVELDSAERLAFLIRMVGLPVGLVLSGVLVALFAGRLVRRIGTLSENTRRLEQGVPLVDAAAPRDELGQLERTLVTTGTKMMELQGELQRLATVDQLTGLINRRGFLDAATQTMELARRNDTPLALLFVDADGLKTVNDTLGHAVGDELLQELGSLLRDTFRQSDLTARVGGDEFCVLISPETWEGVATARDRLLAAIAMANNLPGRVYDVSVSVGVAAFDRESDGSIDHLIARADGLMYGEKHAKRATRLPVHEAVGPAGEDALDLPGA